MKNTYNELGLNCLNYPEMYGEYAPIKYGERVEINTNDICKHTWKHHYDCITNIFKDGIESDIVHKTMLRLVFPGNKKIRLSLFDYWINLIMWHMILDTNSRIEGKHIFFPEHFKAGFVKKYIDDFVIEPFRMKIYNRRLNNIIIEALNYFHDIEEFAYYLSNTINLEDTVFLMNACDEFRSYMYADLSDTSLEEVKDEGMNIAFKSIDIMKDSKKYLGYDHCLADAWRVGQGINPKQYKDTTINIGTKPDGQGSIYPTRINHSFMNGGVTSPADYFVESSTGRNAQIIKKENVGSSGHLARLLGLNNQGTKLNEDINSNCNTQTLVEYTIKNVDMLKKLNMRFYRMNPNGIERCINAKKDLNLIGKKIYVRSPITCASKSHGNGICARCFGNLIYTLIDEEGTITIDPGRFASETASSALTQKLLSAKHMLEAAVEKLVWCDKFSEFFVIEDNLIKLDSENPNFKNLCLLIDKESIEIENDEDDDISTDESVFNEYIVDFAVMDRSTGEVFPIYNSAKEKLYLTNAINAIIRKCASIVDGDKISISFTDIDEDDIFIIPIRNNELSKTLDHFEALLNKNSVVKGLDINSCAQQLVETAIEGGLDVSAIYLEIMVSNQVRDKANILDTVDWSKPHPEYDLITLNSALSNHPSVTVSLSYQKIKRAFYDPLTYKKTKSSYMDLFFMLKPQDAINGNLPMAEEKDNKDKVKYPIVFDDE